MKTPESKRQVREFLGMVRTLESWTPGISASSKLMRGLSAKDVKFIWTADHEDEFNKLKEVVADVNVLSPYDRSLVL